MDKVKKLVEAGVSIPTAIKESLGVPVSEFADKHGRPRPRISNVINGNLRPTDDDLRAFIAELGGTELEWRVLLLQAGMSPEERAAMRQLWPPEEEAPAAERVNVA